VDEEEAVRLRRVINTLARRFNALATDEGLTPTQASVLATVRVRGPIGLTELIQVEHINPTMLSRVVSRLDELGLIVRSPDPEDLRSARLEITPAGAARQDRIREQRAAAVSRGAAALNARDHAALLRALPALEELSKHLTP
jgi:DNA-binding MarR family transcriptional regulator